MLSWGFGRRAPILVLAGALLITACAANSTTTGSGNVGAAPGRAGSAGTTSAAAATTATGASTRDVPIVAAPEQEGVQHLKFKYGPIKIEPGQNNITISNLQVPKPQVDGYIVGIYPDLVRNDGSIPPVDIIHLHHGVWLKVDTSKFGGRRPKPTTPDGAPASTTTTTAAPAEETTQGEAGAGGSNFGQIFFASGEEKTKVLLPEGFGYPYKAKDVWVINYMLHNILSTPDEVNIVYNLDFIPADSPGAAKIKAARPIWNDVENGKIYPVFDVIKGSGKDGKYTYPDDAVDPYKGLKTNQWTVDRDSVLLGTAGHLHPGGLYTDMFVTRAGAGAAAADAAKASITGDKAHVFRSDAIYYEPAGAVSWDVSMTTTPFDWKVGVKKGDLISINATYDAKRASWYESMGIMVLWITDAENVPASKDPFQTKVDAKGVLTHGHLAENDNHGGGPSAGKFVDMTKLANGKTDGTVTIADFAYAPGDMSGIYNDVPTVKPGETIRFFNKDAPIKPNGVWHTVTACKAPCDGSTGVAYPLADADVQFDSGELGKVGPPTAGRDDWTIPTNLAAGTYTYFCRIHPIMRGAFRVDAGASSTTAQTAPGK